jgi:RHS repeat-associated protein
MPTISKISMKTKFTLGRCIKTNALYAILGVVMLAIFSVRGMAADANDYTARLLQSKMFKGPLVWVGTTPPSEAESKALWLLAEKVQASHDPDGMQEFEGFIAQYPQSPWVPSIRANLAYYYRWTGRYTPALHEWEAAWEATRDAHSGPGKDVADFTLVYWIPLLSSLGRVDELQRLYSEAPNWRMERLDWQEQWVRGRNAMVTMKKNPGISYRCGTLALAQVARVLSPAFAQDIGNLVRMHSPQTGFSMSSLVKIADQYNLGLVAMQRVSGDTLVVPSVIHWRQNHYAAIMQQLGDHFLVIDPTFGQPKWLSREVINSEASGAFLIPAGKKLPGWRPLSPAETDSIYGKGLDLNNIKPPPPPCPDPSQSANSCPTNQPPCNCPSNPPPPGMTSWSVSEPEISLWLQDTPMNYKTSTGKDFPLKFYYYQRETRPIGTNIFNFGTNWDCTWLSYLDVNTEAGGDTNFNTFGAALYGSGGGQLNFVADPSDYEAMYGANYGYSAPDAPGFGSYGGTDVTPHYQTHTILQRIGISNNVISGLDTNVTCTGFQELYPNGSVATYGLQVQENGLYTTESYFFLTARTDPQGRNTQFIYDTNSGAVLLKKVIDWDNHTNTLQYNNTNFPIQVSEIDGPYSYSVHLGYDTNGMLTNLTDVAGMTSSYQYMFTTDGIPELTNLTTPYGNTAFNYFQPTADLQDDFFDDGTTNYWYVNRAIQVIQPDGGTNLFLYQQAGPPKYPCPYLPPSYTEDLTGVPVDVDDTETNADGINDTEMYYHNSFFWGPRQYALLSTTNILQLTTNDFSAGRLRNWLDDVNAESPSIVLNMEQSPSPDGMTPGQMTWYGYSGKTVSFPYGFGTNDFPSYIARVLPNGQTEYTYQEYNLWGYPTLKVGTYSVGSTVGLRTNTYIYSTNNIDLLQIIGPDGVTNVSYTYNGIHQLLAETNALGEVTAYTYGSCTNLNSTNSLLTSTTYPGGLVSTNIYNSTGFLVTNFDYAGSVHYGTNIFTYTTNGQVYTYTDARGLSITNTWDALNRLLKVIYPDGTGITNTYTNLDLAKTVDRMGFANSFAYDNMRRMKDWTNALGKVTSYTYCSCGSLESITDPLSHTTIFSYDYQGRKTEVAYPDSYNIYYNYDLIGNVTNISDSAGASFTNWYNNQGLLYAVSNAAGQMVAGSYDINDCLTNYVNPNNVSLGITYDKLWRPLTGTYPDGGVERWGYTPNVPYPISYTNQITNVVTYAYDPLYRKTNEVAVGITTNSFAYDGASDLLTLTDGKNQTTTWSYDQYGRVTNKLDALGTNIFIYQYDPDSRLTNRWSAAKGTTVYRYDPVGNLTNVDYSGGTVTMSNLYLAYDALNRLTNMVDAVGTTTYSYDQVGQLLSEGGLWPNDTVSYTYYNRLKTGLSLQAPDASAWTESYGYDTARRLTSLTSPAGTFGCAYDPTNLLKIDKLTLPNSAYITNTYDNVARLTGTCLENSGNTNLDSQNYVYNQAGQRTSETNAAGDYRAYSYDNAGTLTSSLGFISATTNRLQDCFDYFYDAAGNLVKKNNPIYATRTTVQYGINSLNEIINTVLGGPGGLMQTIVSGSTTSPATNVTVNSASASIYPDSTFAIVLGVTNGVNTFTAIAQDVYNRWSTNVSSATVFRTNNFYTYDLNGNMLSDGARNFAYDDENQLISVWLTNAWRCDFVYDGKLRRRIERDYSWNGSSWTQTNEIHFIYDGNMVIQERDINNLPKVTYTRGNDLSGSLQGAGGIGGLLARSDNTQMIIGSPSAHAFYHADGNGNVTMLINNVQAIVAKYLYDPFGNTLSLSGSLAGANTYRFSSKEWNESAGLYYCLYRYYDPNLQRWLNRDPIQEWGGLNLYQFVRNSPILSIDLLGLGVHLNYYPPGFGPIGVPNPDPTWSPYSSSPPSSPIIPSLDPYGLDNLLNNWPSDTPNSQNPSPLNTMFAANCPSSSIPQLQQKSTANTAPWAKYTPSFIDPNTGQINFGGGLSLGFGPQNLSPTPDPGDPDPDNPRKKIYRLGYLNYSYSLW